MWGGYCLCIAGCSLVTLPDLSQLLCLHSHTCDTTRAIKSAHTSVTHICKRCKIAQTMSHNREHNMILNELTWMAFAMFNTLGGGTGHSARHAAQQCHWVCRVTPCILAYFKILASYLPLYRSTPPTAIASAVLSFTFQH